MKLRDLLSAGLALAIASRAAPAAADGACIDDRAKQAIACTPGIAPAAPPTPGARPGLRTAPPRAAAPRRAAPAAIDGVRDDRKIRLEARRTKLLVDEVLKVESLLGTTPRSAPDRSTLARRLADDYVELESAAFRDKTEAEIRRDAAAATQADRMLRSSRKRAIELYGLLASDYPKDPKVDEVLYYLAYEHEAAGDAKRARAAYYELIQKAPASPYVANAYLAFGEMFYSEALGDPSRWDLAAQAYAEAIKYPPPRNKAHVYALYKSAHVHWNKGDLDRALDAFKRTIEAAVANPALPGATRLAESARRDLVPVYALKGDPKLAFGFLKRVAGDAPGSSEATFRMMDDLGVAYADTGHYPEAIAVYRDLLARDRGPGRGCRYQAGITDATMAMRAGDKDAVKSELDALLRTAAGVADARCQGRAAALVTETAIAWHIEAIGSNGQRGTYDARTMTLAAELYQRALDTWSAKDLTSFEFPRLVKEDWPTRHRLRYALADLLYAQQSWARCGPAFDAVLAEDPRGPDAAGAAYAAGLCYQAAFEASHRATPRSGARAPAVAATGTSASLRPKEMSGEQRAMIRAFDRYVCTIKPADAAGRDQLVEVAYARARSWFEAQHWEEAAAGFRAIALDHPGSDAAMPAAQLYLESVNVLARHFGRTSCEADMTADVPRLVELHCTGDRGARNADGCAGLRRVQTDLVRLRAQRLVEAADRAGGAASALVDYERAGTAYFDLFRTQCQDPVANGNKPEAERCDEIAYDAAKAFQAARLLAKAIGARRALISFDERTRLRSPLARKATYEIGANLQAIADYEQAAEWFERHAGADPRAENADRALSDAVLLRLGLAQVDLAMRDAEDFVRRYGATRAELAGSVAYAIAAHHAEKEDWERARAALSGAATRQAIDRAPPDVQLQAHATLARALFRLGGARAAEARGEIAKVERMWADPAAVERRIRAAYPDEDDARRDRRVGRAIEAVGEALFLAAEARRIAEVDVLRFPEYRGGGDVASVKAHVDGEVRRWYLRKKAAIERVDLAYAKVLELRPRPPPRWVIAAGARAGLLWGDFVDDFRRAPYPRAWKGTELEQVYTTRLDLASEPYKRDHAKPALKKCLDLATRHEYADVFARSCEVWLARNYKDEYHVVDELRAAPTLVSSGLAERAPPVTPGGTFVHVRR